MFNDLIKLTEIINKENNEMEITVVNLEIRQNGKFEFGFPYNNSIDSYFKLLSEDFITNYNLTTEQINDINNHKNAVLEFDRELFDYIIKLSAFMKGFEEESKPLIDTFNSLTKQQEDLRIKYDNIKEASDEIATEFNYIVDNIDNLRLDLEKINEFITFYESQIVAETFVYNSSYIEDTEDRLSIIDSIIDNTEYELNYYDGILENKISDYVNTLAPLKQYDFKATSIKSYYETWINRSEDYYSTLVNYYRDEYTSYWTYGQSIMYDENLSYSKAANNTVLEIAALLQSALVKSYNFTLEKEIKEYSLEWLNNHESFEPFDFTYAIETRKSAILKDMIIDLDNIISTKTMALRNVVSTTMYNDYNRYKELVYMKRKYVFLNLTNGLDLTMLMNYDTEIDSLEENYIVVKAKMEQKTYWVYFHDLERHRELLIELNRQLTINTLALSREFKKESGSNDIFFERIEYYTIEKESIAKKIIDMIDIKDSLELTKNVYNDDLTLMKSKLFELEQSINDIKATFIPIFISRIPFFTQNIEVSETDGVHDLIEGNMYDILRNNYYGLVSYSSNILWFNENDRNKLFDMYNEILIIIERELSFQWNYEFSQDIISDHKVSYYASYVDKQLSKMYGMVHYLVLQNRYDPIGLDKIKEHAEYLVSIFHKYVELAFKSGVDIEISTDIFNYDEKFIFRISDNIETKENVNTTFSKFINVVLNYITEKNLDFKLFENNKENQIKIDTIWNDMEKRYV